MSCVSKMVHHVCVDEAAVICKLTDIIQTEADNAIKQRGRFIIAVSGGSMGKFLPAALLKIKTDWSVWRIAFCDERCVAFDNVDSTYRVYKEATADKLPLTEDNFVVIDPSLNVEAAAVDYNNKLSSVFGCTASLPVFDMLFLGVGPDGHTCSLFPAHPLLSYTSTWVAAIADSPKPPPCRVTLTLPVINNARICVFAMCGEGKADIVKRIVVDKEDLPATLVKPTSGHTHWILDTAAAKHIPAAAL